MAARWPVVVAIAVLAGAGGCSREPREVGERVDPNELEYVPSIIASARRLVDGVQETSGPLFRRDAHAKAHGCLYPASPTSSVPARMWTSAPPPPPSPGTTGSKSGCPRNDTALPVLKSDCKHNHAASPVYK